MKKLFFTLFAIPFLLSFTDWEPRADQYVTKDDIFQGYTLVADSFLIVKGDTLRPGELLHFSDTTELLVTQHLLDSLLGAKVDTADYSDLDVLNKVKNVDGSGSGLDADLLNSQDHLYYLDNTDDQVLSYDSSSKELTIEDGNTVAIDITVGNVVNSYSSKIDITSNTVNVTFPTAFSNPNYFLDINAYYAENVDSKDILIRHGIYNFNKTVSGFTISVDTIAGYLEYFAADTTNLYPLSFDNYVSLTQLSDSLASVVVEETDPVFSASSWASTTNNSISWDESYGWLNQGVKTTDSPTFNNIYATRFMGGTYPAYYGNYLDLSAWSSFPQIAFGFASGSKFNIQEESQSAWGGAGVVMQAFPSVSTKAFAIEAWSANGLYLGTGNAKDIGFFINRSGVAKFVGTTGNFLLNATTDNEIDKFQVEGSAIVDTLKIGDQSIKIYNNGSGDIVIEDTNTGPKTLAELASGGSTFSGASVYNSVNFYTTAAGVYNYVLFDSENFDTDNYHDTSTNTSRLTIPADGYYDLSFSCNADVTIATTGVSIRLMKNSYTTLIERSYFQDELWSTSHFIPLTIPTSTQYCAAGDYFEVSVILTTANSIRIIDPPSYAGIFQIKKL